MGLDKAGRAAATHHCYGLHRPAQTGVEFGPGVGVLTYVKTPVATCPKLNGENGSAGRCDELYLRSPIIICLGN